MSQTLFWIQCGGCGGDTMALLGSDVPDLAALPASLGIELLWHPSLSTASPAARAALTDEIVRGAHPLDILVVEGAALLGPDGSGRFDMYRGRPKAQWIADLAAQARYVVAAGTCAAFGGIAAAGNVGGTGLQFLGHERGGLLGRRFRSGAGAPVINLAGCPCHPEVLTGTLTALASDRVPELDDLQRPQEWYGITVHQGCTRNEYHEYRVEEEDFAQRGCLFFHKGCHGPLTDGPCNKLLWNGRSSKPRAGVPCFGCTDPGFPSLSPFFETPNIEGIPIALPKGVGRAHYMAYKSMAAAAAPERLKRRETGV